MIWKIIEDFPDYMISNTGQVLSVKRTVNRVVGDKIHKKIVNQRILKPSYRNGYAFVTLRKNNSHKANMIHHHRHL